jgi:hypothetical protein
MLEGKQVKDSRVAPGLHLSANIAARRGMFATALSAILSVKLFCPYEVSSIPVFCRYRPRRL